jgi:ADP-ribosylglycohydrolase
MFGAIAGDVIGSVFERFPIKTTRFPLFSPLSRFTDDTVLTVAIADAILKQNDYAAALKAFGRKYPAAGYGGSFYQWIHSSDSSPYNSWGNGSAMRVSPIGFAFDSADTVLSEAKKTAEVTHNHPEGIKGAQATALAVFLARSGNSKKELKQTISDRFAYDLNRSLDEIRPVYTFDISCQGSVPEAIIAFLQGKNYEEVIRNAISLGGDSDTLACIAGGIAQAYYQNIPTEIVQDVRSRLPEQFLSIIDAFNERFSLML